MTIGPPQDLNFDLYIYAPYDLNNPRDSSTRGAGETETVETLADSPGYWYIRVVAVSEGGFGFYTLTVDVTPPPWKSWSFEDRAFGPPYTYGGVYNCSPWETNQPINLSQPSGWRELRGDVCPDEGDGKCNYLDLYRLADAYMSYGPSFHYPEEPASDNWDPYCDIDGNGKVNYEDLFTLADDYGKEANRIHGSYSWSISYHSDPYVAGGSIYNMSYWLSNDDVNTLKGQQITFSFWAYPKSVSPDGLENLVSAEIQIVTETSAPSYFGWVNPTEIDWHLVTVTATIPVSATHIKLQINGYPNFESPWDEGTFEALIDYASIAICT